MVETKIKPYSSLPAGIDILQTNLRNLAPDTLEELLSVFEGSYKENWLGVEHLSKKTNAVHILSREGHIIGACSYNNSRMYTFCLNRGDQGQGLAQEFLAEALKDHPKTWMSIAAEAYSMIKLMTSPRFGLQLVTDKYEVRDLFLEADGSRSNDQFRLEFVENEFLSPCLQISPIPIFAHSESIHGTDYWQIILKLPRAA